VAVLGALKEPRYLVVLGIVGDGVGEGRLLGGIEAGDVVVEETGRQGNGRQGRGSPTTGLSTPQRIGGLALKAAANGVGAELGLLEAALVLR
jgi:hypothetical protein